MVCSLANDFDQERIGSFFGVPDFDQGLGNGVIIGLKKDNDLIA